MEPNSIAYTDPVWNNDGNSDLIVGAYQYNGSKDGYVNIYFGNGTKDMDTILKLYLSHSKNKIIEGHFTETNASPIVLVVTENQ